MKIFYILFLTVCMIFTSSAQELFRLDFETEKVPEDWVASDKSEWGRVLGENGGSFFRFHPFAANDALESPTLALEDGFYVIYFSWSEVIGNNPNFIDVRYKEGNGEWQEIADFGGLEGGGTDRVWQQDSAVLGNLEAGNYTIQFRYTSTGRFPSQYMNLDNIYLNQSDFITSLTPILEQLDVQVYPNPVANRLQFSLNDDQNRNFMAEVINAQGQLVKTEGNINSNGNNLIDVSALPKGNYLLRLVTAEGIKTEIFVIQ